ncbi:PBP1A family penicillin-binding protein [Zavarzinia compransoris]|uniref:transglycosylase domain-containing protein n=1 Tax=Zavarzinia marina TaxID=2911065 RepID=UPI001F19324C|nr:PBP1A family penicillin-binding protein [Zavarzinia marina]MCF4167436.1 PBP1A family penicillin-binding protein [Zavarzinia marina]
MAGENQKGTRRPRAKRTSASGHAPGGSGGRGGGPARIDRLDRRATPPQRLKRGGKPKASGGSGAAKRRGILYWLMVGGIWGGLAVAAIVAFFAWDMPSIARLNEIDRRPAVKLVSADGTTFATVGDLYGDTLSLQQYPKVLVDAVLAIEDRRFFEHGGFDPIGILRAIYHNLATGSISQGGSTISQQTVKTVFLTPERTVRRKVQEAILTVQLEGRLSKDQILALYLNRVYLGSGAYGMDGAARRYFGHSARQLGLAEAAMLAGLMKAPSRYSPIADYDAATARAAVVLDAMVDAGFVSGEQAAAAKARPARLAARPVSDDARYFVDWVVEQVANFAGPEVGDITVETTLDLGLQRVAEAALDAGLAGEGARLDAGQGALVALAPDGAVKAMVGGRDYNRSPFNRAVRALRQPGSAFKLFVYLAALEAGLTPDSRVFDGPVDIAGYRPSNFGGRHAGEMSLGTAFARSVNTVAVKLLAQVGARRVVAMARRLGITTPIPANASIALGSAEVTPLELTAAYAALANGGRAVEAFGIRRVLAADGDVIFAREGAGAKPALNATVVGRMNRMLAAVIDGGTGHEAAFGRPAGGKTGTSQDYRNAWFVGLTGDLVAGVWVGNDDNSPMVKVTGGGLPARVWKNFMAAAFDGKAVAPLPMAPTTEDRDLLDRLVDFLGGDSGGGATVAADGGGGGADPAPARRRPVIEYEYPTGREF